MISRSVLLALAIAASCAPAAAQRRGGDGDGYRDRRPGLMQRLRNNDEPPMRRRDREQDQAYHARRQGTLRPLRDIEGGVVPEMRRRGADYIGAELDGGERPRYRLKFMRGGSVIWVDVDGRTGEVVGRAGDE